MNISIFSNSFCFEQTNPGIHKAKNPNFFKTKQDWPEAFGMEPQGNLTLIKQNLSCRFSWSPAGDASFLPSSFEWTIRVFPEFWYWITQTSKSKPQTSRFLQNTTKQDYLNAIGIKVPVKLALASFNPSYFLPPLAARIRLTVYWHSMTNLIITNHPNILFCARQPLARRVNITRL